MYGISSQALRHSGGLDPEPMEENLPLRNQCRFKSTIANNHSTHPLAIDTRR